MRRMGEEVEGVVVEGVVVVVLSDQVYRSSMKWSYDSKKEELYHSAYRNIHLHRSAAVEMTVYSISSLVRTGESTVNPGSVVGVKTVISPNPSTAVHNRHIEDNSVYMDRNAYVRPRALGKRWDPDVMD